MKQHPVLLTPAAGTGIVGRALKNGDRPLRCTAAAAAFIYGVNSLCQAPGQVPKSQQGIGQGPWPPGACALAACVMEMPFPNSLSLAKIHTPPLQIKQSTNKSFLFPELD